MHEQPEPRAAFSLFMGEGADSIQFLKQRMGVKHEVDLCSGVVR